MERKIPIYFDSIIASPVERISNENPNLGRLKVGVFTKYGNRNGSYITDAVAEQLIRSATQGQTPVVGFFDPETKSWAGHTGPTLASAYGYVEDFIEWAPLQDSDGVTRDYAIFSVALFNQYYEEAQFIPGQNQSMELDVNSITGDWGSIENSEYFIYATAKIKGLCIIGSHEPCFSASSFFEKNDEQYESQNEKFSSLLFDLKQQIEEAEKNTKGGEKVMNEPIQEGLETTPEVTVEDQPIVESEPAPAEFEENAPAVEPESETEGSALEETVNESSEPSEFEVLQNQLNELQTSFNTLNEQYTTAQARIAELETSFNNANEELEALHNTNNELQAQIATYEAERINVLNAQKEQLIDKYAKYIASDELDTIRAEMANYSCEELESKLAINYANTHISDSEEEKVPLPDPAISSFALFMQKYRKN